MGSVTTWRTFEYALDYFRYFIPMSCGTSLDDKEVVAVRKQFCYVRTERGKSAVVRYGLFAVDLYRGSAVCTLYFKVHDIAVGARDVLGVQVFGA